MKNIRKYILKAKNEAIIMLPNLRLYKNETLSIQTLLRSWVGSLSNKVQSLRLPNTLVSNIFTPLVLCLFFVNSFNIYAQENINYLGGTVIKDPIFVTVLDTVDFNPSTIDTPDNVYAERLSSSSSKLVLDTHAIAINYSAAAFTDGFVQARGKTEFTFPIGDNSRLGLAAFKAATPTTVDAVYYDADPSVAITSDPINGGNSPALPTGAPFSTTAITGKILAVSTNEYWDIDGASPVFLTLSYTATSDVNTLTAGNVEALSIAGWNGSSWERIASVLDTTSLFGTASVLDSGSITTSIAIIPNTYTAYTIAAMDLTSPGGVFTDLALWLKAEVGTNNSTDGDVVASWIDQSGARTNTAQSSSGVQNFRNNLTDNINFNPVVDFDGEGGMDFGDDYIFTPAAKGGNTTFSVVEPDDADAGKSRQYIFDFGAFSSEGYGLTYGDEHYGLYTPGSHGGTSSLDFTHTFGTTPSIVSWDIDFGSFHIFGRNGSDLFNQPITLTNLDSGVIQESPTIQASLGPVSIGRQANSGTLGSSPTTRAFDGSIGEVIQYTSDISPTDRQKIESYLALKYGVWYAAGTKDYVASDWDGTSGTIFWDVSAFNFVGHGNYNRDIFGIVRDDASGLDQRVATSIETDDVLTVALDANFTAANTDLATRSTSFDNDLDFIIFGNNNGSIAPSSSTEFGIDYTGRIAREWYVNIQNTGVTETINLKFQGFGTDYALVKSTGTFGDFTANSTIVGYLDANGEISNVTLSDGDFITLMQPFEIAPGGVAGSLRFWYKADTAHLTMNGSDITAWSDLSRNSTDVSVISATNRPTLDETKLINFHKQVRFGGAADEVFENADISLTGSEMRGTYARSWYFVTSDLDSSGVGLFENPLSVSNSTQYFKVESSNYAIASHGDGLFHTHSGASPYLSWLRLSMFFQSNPANHGHLEMKMERNVLNAIPFTWPPSVLADNGITNRLLIGGYYINPTSGLTTATGGLPEVILYDSQLTGLDKQKVDSYVALKYGIRMGSGNIDYVASDGSTLMWSTAAAATGFNRAIFGIGRDDASGLLQKVSQSQWISDPLIVSLDDNFTAANDDAARASTFNNDLSFVVFSSNTGTLTWSTANKPCVCKGIERIGRTWQVQETGAVDSVWLAFNAESLKIPSDSRGVYLLVDDDGDADMSSAPNLAYYELTFDDLGDADASNDVYKTQINFSHLDKFTVAYYRDLPRLRHSKRRLFDRGDIPFRE